MVKNISNPLNARKIAKILADDALNVGISLPEREISVYLSDNEFRNVYSAIEALKDKELISKEFIIGQDGIELLIKNEFIEEVDRELQEVTPEQVTPDSTVSSLYSPESELDTLEFKNQFESLKKKIIKLWSGGLTVDTQDLDKFDVKFARPMTYFSNEMKEKNIEISELQSYAVIFAADHLGLSDDSRENAYNLMFGRFETIMEILKDKFGIYYSWPEVTGSMYIDIGKKFSIGPELADFAIRLRTVSGLDTYSDEVIHELFKQLIIGGLTDELISRKTIFRWKDKDFRIDKPIEWIIPPMGYNVSIEKKVAFIQTTLTHTILTKIDDSEIKLEDLLDQVYLMNNESRINYLAKRLEHALTRKSVGLQFGTTLANFYENFKTNPAKSAPFIDTTIRYFQKVSTIQSLLQQVHHSIVTGLKNSIGLIKKYLRDLSDEKLTNSINTILYHSLEATIPTLEKLSDFADLNTPDLLEDYETFNTVLFTMDDEQKKTFFTLFMDNAFKYTQEFAKSLEPESTEPISKEGGLAELTHDFLSAVMHNANKNPDCLSMIENQVSNGIAENIAEIIIKITSYLTYQIAGKEGERGKTLHNSLAAFFSEKAIQLGNVRLLENKTIDEFMKILPYNFMLKELTQAHVIISLGSKTKTEVFNAWTPLTDIKSKNILYLNEFIIPNMLYWQRLPKDLIDLLSKNNLIDKNIVKSIVNHTRRMNLIDAYSLLLLASKPNINTFDEAQIQLAKIFNIPETDASALDSFFNLKPRTGEAEIVKETSFLWLKLQNLSGGVN